MSLHTTLRLLRRYEACEGRYAHLVSALGNETDDDAPIPILRILDINGLDDALWALRAVPPDQRSARDRISRLLACDFAERVLPIFEEAHPHDARPRDAIAVARRYAAGNATAAELTAAYEAAREAVWAVASVADWAAASAGEAARAAARASAWEAAWGAAWEADWAAAMVAARVADWEAERTWQSQRLREVLGTTHG